MIKLVIASTTKSAGKTSVAIGLAKALNLNYGYIKPFGDRLLYRKKRLWDADSALIANLHGLEPDSESMTVGFEHAKLRYMYSPEAVRQKLQEIAATAGQGKELLLVEGGKDLPYGASINLDAISVAKAIGARLLIVISGDPDAIVDDAFFLKRSMEWKEVDFVGIIANKVKDPADFKQAYLPRLAEAELPVLGVMPQLDKLCCFSAGFLADRLFAKILAGQGAMNRTVDNVFIGAMSASAAQQNPLFNKGGKLVITSGDRSDMILASLESDTAAVIVTDGALPPSNIISTAAQKNVPLLVVPGDTYQTARQIESMEPLLTKDDTAKLELLGRTVKECVKLQELI